MESNDIIERLKIDEDYYGKFGSQFLSNSDIKALRSDIKSFRKPVRLNEALEAGRYFHQLLLEEDKAKNFPMVDAKTRNAKEYKEYLEENKVEFVLKTNEAMAIKNIADWVMDDKTACTQFIRDLLKNPEALREQPVIADLHGHQFKGKADLITTDESGQYVIIDFKTTSGNPSDFNKWTLDSFGYNSQAYLYREMFGMNFKFIFIGKKPKEDSEGKIYYDVCEITPSDETLDMGRMRVIEALADYERYYGEGATEDVRASYIKKVI